MKLPEGWTARHTEKLMDDTEFRVGDTVCLKSGGPVMTVMAITTDAELYCWRYRVDGSMDMSTLKAACVTRVDVDLSKVRFHAERE
jgi:uncharacterized protein YodC (DUF2158 family)